MIALLVIIVALALTCIWLLFRARQAEDVARIAREDADAQFELWCEAAAKRDHLREVVRWLQMGEDARARRSAGGR